MLKSIIKPILGVIGSSLVLLLISFLQSMNVDAHNPSLVTEQAQTTTINSVD